jgi:hypothetical protein
MSSSLYNSIIEALIPLVEAFDQLGIPYYIGGSVASSVHGMPRRTQDVDVIVEIRIDQVRRLVQMLQDDYYIDEDALRDALRHHISYNVIYLTSMIKVDLIPPKQRAFTQEAVRRAQPYPLEAGTHPFNIISAEDSILTKLEWYEMGGRTSARQWGDILGVLKKQGTALDLAYLDRWATALGVTDLLERALVEAGLR